MGVDDETELEIDTALTSQEVSTGVGSSNFVEVSVTFYPVDDTLAATILPTYAFYNYTDLENIILNKNLTTIQDYVFSNTKLNQITIPASVTDISESAFNDCPNLKTIYFLGDKPTGFDDLLFTNSPILSHIFYSYEKNYWVSETLTINDQKIYVNHILI